MTPAPLLIAWLLRRFGFRAITLPPFGVYALAEHIDSQRLIRHEQCHWRQYERMGAIRFYVGYIALWVRHGYQNHPWEVEAREAEHAN